MNDVAQLDAYGALIEPATLKIQRLLPGPVERIWTYLTDSDQRRRWLAAGEMELTVGAPFELVWRNEELDGPASKRPDGFPEEHSMESRITEVNAPYRLSFTWGERGEVTIDLDPRGDEVLLTLVHKRISDRANILMIGAGWHMHLDTLVAVANGETPAPFWEGWQRLKAEYDRRVPARMDA